MANSLAIAIKLQNEANTALRDLQRELQATEAAGTKAGGSLRDAGDKVAKAGRDADSSRGHFSGLGSALGNVAQIAGGFVIGQGLLKLPGLVSGMIGSASDLNESLSKVQVVFGENADAIEDFADSAAKNLGIAKGAALEAAGTFGNLFKAMGIGEQPTKDMSEGILKLAADLASFNNLNPEDVLEKLRAGLVGETEPLRSLGVNLNAAAIQAKALDLGLVEVTVDSLKVKAAVEKADDAQRKYNEALKKFGPSAEQTTDAQLELEKASATVEKAMEGSTGELSAAAKAQAAYALIMEQTTTAQGDFARTAGGSANQIRIMKAQFADLQADLGAKLLPVMIKVGQIILTEVIPRLQQFAVYFEQNIQPRIEAFVAWLGPKLIEAGEFFKKEIQPRIEEFVKWVVPKLKEFGDWIGVQFARFQVYYESDIKPALENIRKGVDAVIGWIREHWPEIEAIVKPVLEEVKNTVQTTFAIIREVLQIFIDLLQGDFSGAWKNFKELIGVVMEGIRESIENKIELIKGILSAAWAAIKHVATEAWGEIKATITEALTDLWLLIAGRVGDIKNTLGELPAKALEIGKGIVTGLWEGIESLKDWIVQKVTDFGGWIKDGIETGIGWLKPGSPSRFGIAVGEGIGLGIEEGVRRTLPNVARAAAEVRGAVENMVAEVNAALATVGSGQSFTLGGGAGSPHQRANAPVGGGGTGRVFTLGGGRGNYARGVYWFDDRIGRYREGREDENGPMMPVGWTPPGRANAPVVPNTPVGGGPGVVMAHAQDRRPRVPASLTSTDWRNRPATAPNAPLAGGPAGAGVTININLPNATVLDRRAADQLAKAIAPQVDYQLGRLQARRFTPQASRWNLVEGLT